MIMTYQQQNGGPEAVQGQIAAFVSHNREVQARAAQQQQPPPGQNNVPLGQEPQRQMPQIGLSPETNILNLNRSPSTQPLPRSQCNQIKSRSYTPTNCSFIPNLWFR